MSLIKETVNPLSVLGCRRLYYMPEHFKRLTVNKSLDIENLSYWINYHLNSRYAIRKKFMLDQNKKVIEVIEVGFEDPSEITFFTLGCPHLHSKRD